MLSYCPHYQQVKGALAEEAVKAKGFVIALKNDKMLWSKGDNEAVSAAELVARLVRDGLEELPFRDFFSGGAALIPVPRSSLLKKGELWVPGNIATAMERLGLGRRLDLLRRVSPVPRSSTSRPRGRPLPEDHRSSMLVTLSSLPKWTRRLVLIDDVITRGSTMYGAATLLWEAYGEGVEVVGFAAVRTISDPGKFKGLYDPLRGVVILRDAGDTLRRP